MDMNATYITGPSIRGGAQQQANLHLYLHQNWSGPNANQTASVNPPTNNSFGEIIINDWTISEERDRGSKVIARAQGMHAQCGQNKQSWNISFTMVFEDNRFNGSTLEVRGIEDKFEWAIVGGTGRFALAQGTVYGKLLSEDANGRVVELFIHVFYRTIEKPKL